MSDETIFVVKKSGEREPFSEAKVIRSMQRVGVPQDVWPDVLSHVKSKLHPNITTSEVFYHIQEDLREKHTTASLRFNLKQAMFELGPTGFPFEKYMARVFQTMDFKTKTDQIMSGACVNHEIDIVIEKDGKTEVIEAKFHNQQGIKTDIQVAMYTYARFLDVKEKNKVDGVGIVTNTKLSEDAITYTECKGVRAIAWNYPESGNLQDFVEKPSMYPITILSGFNNEEKQRMMENDIILACDILFVTDNDLEGRLYLKHDRIVAAKEKAQTVCKNHLHKPITLKA